MDNHGDHFYEFEDFRLDAGRGVLFRGDAIVQVTPKAVEILRLLVENRGETVSKEEILSRVWPDSFVEEANLSHHIFKLRKALEEDDRPKLIETVPKRGYRFVGKLREPEPAGQPAVAISRSLNWKIPAAAMILLAAAATIAWFAYSRTAVDISPAAAPVSSTIAVLPFVNESGDEGIEYLAEGMTESLIGRLSGTESLRVKPYSAVSRYKETAKIPESIGAELKVEFVLSGRMTKRGESVRLFLSLIDIGSGYQTWGKQYERDVSTLATLQGEIIKDVSDYLPGKLPGSDRDNAQRRNSEAYVLYLKGRYQLNRKTADGLRKAIEHFNEAVAVDSSYALAHSGIADAYNQMGQWVTLPPAETFPKAKLAAEHALSLDNQLAEARTALALAKFYYDWDFAGAERDLRQAIRNNPDYTLARESFGIVVYESNPTRFEEALAELNAASSIDPVALAPYFWRGALYYFEGNSDQALRELGEAHSIDPNFTLGLGLKGAVYREKGQHDEYVNNWLSASPLEGVDLSEAEIKALRGAYAANGLKGYEIAYAELLQKKSAKKYVSPLFVAMHYSIAGEKDLAIEWLEKAFADRSSWIVELKVDPAWKNLHSDPRYQDLLRRIGFPE